MPARAPGDEIARLLWSARLEIAGEQRVLNDMVKAIYEQLETLTDECKSVATALEAIVLKYA